ncbi:MAG: Pr6Pr family membrane protein [Devosia sp.]
MKQTLTWVGFVAGAAALILQLAITLPLRLDKGDSLVGALLFYFSFFTILSNLALVLIYAAELWPRAPLGWFRRPVTQGMMAAAITLVMVFYHLILAETWDPQGLSLVCDVTLHYVTPLLYLAWWLLCRRHGALRWSDIPAMLVPPAIYLVWAMARGAVVGEYPYPILEANRIGYMLVALNVVMVLAGLTALCALAIGADQALARTRRLPL